MDHKIVYQPNLTQEIMATCSGSKKYTKVYKIVCFNEYKLIYHYVTHVH